MKNIKSNIKFYFMVGTGILTIILMLIVNAVEASSVDIDREIQEAKQAFAYHLGGQEEIDYIVDIINQRISQHYQDGSVQDYHYHMGSIHELEFLKKELKSVRWNHHQDEKKIAEDRAGEARDLIKKKAYKLEEPKVLSNGLDLDKLAYAVSWAETSNCQKAKWNNCFGIMYWDKNGVRHQKRYKTTEESFEDFKELWARSYKIFPNIQLATKYTGNDRPHDWLRIVKHYYYK